MKNNTFRKILALALVWCLTLGSMPAVAFSDGTDAEVISTPAPESTAAPADNPTSEPTAEPTAEPKEEPTAEPTVEPTAEPTGERDMPVCTCGTDEPEFHATDCAVYVRPENPVCYCVEKCTEANVWCDVCGFDASACGGEDIAAAYEDVAFSITIDIIGSGTATADKTTAAEGETVTLTATPNAGYEMETISVTPTVTLTQAADGKFTFSMPMSDVTVTATFKAIEPSYIITIPSAVNLNDADGMTITADVENLGNNKLEVNVASANGYQLVNGTNAIGYTVSAQKFSFTEDGSFLMELAVGDTAGKPAGEYSDTLTFTANIQSDSLT